MIEASCLALLDTWTGALAIMSPEMASLLFWGLMAAVFGFFWWRFNIAFVAAVEGTVMPSDARASFYKRWSVVLVVTVVLAVLFWFLREKIVYDGLGWGGA